MDFPLDESYFPPNVPDDAPVLRPDSEERRMFFLSQARLWDRMPDKTERDRYLRRAEVARRYARRPRPEMEANNG